MTRQLNLFPERAVAPDNRREKDPFADQDIELNAVDELFMVSSPYRHSQPYIQLLQSISRFPNYSPFNCFLLYTQNPSLSYVATAKTWSRKFRRQPKFNARPMVILAPMGPIRFVFDINDTEGYPVADEMLQPAKPKAAHLNKIFENTVANCTIQSINVFETPLDNGTADTATRITPALRKKHKDLDLKKDANYLIILNKQHSLEDKYSAMVYELGHIFCGHLGIDSHAWWPERHGLNVSGEEIEAESTALLVCRRTGLTVNSDKYLLDYISEDQELPLFSLNAVLQAVSYIEDMGKTRWSKPKKRSRY